ncbi:hypothetical protein ARMGADRAFT_1087905 [Armillaria gallica]|uniref:Uncharacterized protein n=1 Tax=Armillaria gallica TaxID=47427 RepID=A0A2H3CPN7_ARMGA|nr:hypothetical protein ARMGADRAFT_1087905 [Armillaria gallica]
MQVYAAVKDKGKASMSKGNGKATAPATVKINPLSTYYYIEKVPVPIHKDEYQALLKAPPAVSSVWAGVNVAVFASPGGRAYALSMLSLCGGIVFQDLDILAELKTILDTFDNPKPSVAKLPVKGLTHPPVHHSKPGPLQSSKSAQHIEVTLHSSNEESNSDSHSSVIGSLLEPSGHNPNSDQNLSAPNPDPDALEDELSGDTDLTDEKELAALADEFHMTKEKLCDMNQDLETELQTLKDKGVPLETIINLCKSVCTIRAQLIIHHATTIIGDLKAEDMYFHMKQAFECILDEHLTTSMFKDYHTVRSFTGTIHSRCKKWSVAVPSAIATVTTPPVPVPAAPAQTVATSGKAKASKALAKWSCHLAKSWAIIEDLSDKEASIVAANKEDTVMATVHCKADTIISHFEQMNIDEDVEVIVNRDPTTSNIIEGHKILLPKFLKNKKLSRLLRPREKEKAEHPNLNSSFHKYHTVKVTITKGKANKATIQARKYPHASTDHALKDSPFTIAVADLAINNEASQSTINAATALVSGGDHIEYLLKYHEFVVAHHGQVIKQLESHLPVPMEDNSSALVASSSKLS